MLGAPVLRLVRLVMYFLIACAWSTQMKQRSTKKGMAQWSLLCAVGCSGHCAVAQETYDIYIIICWAIVPHHSCGYCGTQALRRLLALVGLFVVFVWLSLACLGRTWSAEEFVCTTLLAV